MLKERRKAIDDKEQLRNKKLINTNSYTRKKTQKAKVDAEVQKAKDAITQANSNNDVDQVQNSETATIAGIQRKLKENAMKLRKMKLTNIQQLHKKKRCKEKQKWMKK